MPYKVHAFLVEVIGGKFTCYGCEAETSLECFRFHDSNLVSLNMEQYRINMISSQSRYRFVCWKCCLPLCTFHSDADMQIIDVTCISQARGLLLHPTQQKAVGIIVLDLSRQRMNPDSIPSLCSKVVRNMREKLKNCRILKRKVPISFQKTWPGIVTGVPPGRHSSTDFTELRLQQEQLEKKLMSENSFQVQHTYCRLPFTLDLSVHEEYKSKRPGFVVPKELLSKETAKNFPFLLVKNLLVNSNAVGIWWRSRRSDSYVEIRNDYKSNDDFVIVDDLYSAATDHGDVDNEVNCNIESDHVQESRIKGYPESYMENPATKLNKTSEFLCEKPAGLRSTLDMTVVQNLINYSRSRIVLDADVSKFPVIQESPDKAKDLRAENCNAEKILLKMVDTVADHENVSHADPVRAYQKLSTYFDGNPHEGSDLEHKMEIEKANRMKILVTELLKQNVGHEAISNNLEYFKEQVFYKTFVRNPSGVVKGSFGANLPKVCFEISGIGKLYDHIQQVDYLHEKLPHVNDDEYKQIMQRIDSVFPTELKK